MTRLSFVTALALLLLSRSQAHAVVEAEMPLTQLVKDSQVIALARLEQVDAEKGRGSLIIERTLRGGDLPADIPIKLLGSDAGEGRPLDMLERVNSGTTLVLFLSSLSAQEHQAFAYSNGSWFKLRGVGGLDQLKLLFVQGEPYLRRTFHGETAELTKLLDSHLAGMGELPGLDKSAKAMLGPKQTEAAPVPEPVAIALDQIELGPAWQVDEDAKTASPIALGNYVVVAILLAAVMGLALMLTRSSPGEAS